MSNDIEIIYIDKLNIDYNYNNVYKVGSTDPIPMNIRINITLKGGSTFGFLEKHMNYPITIRGVIGDNLYIFEDSIIKSYDVDIGDRDEITRGSLEIDANRINICNLNIKFTDATTLVNPINYCLVIKNYGELKKMSYDEFKQKCLAVKI